MTRMTWAWTMDKTDLIPQALSSQSYVTTQANRLLAGSCSAPNSLRAPGQGGLEMLTAMAWKEDNGDRGPRGLRGD